jgi:hypothetical protein
LAARYARIGDSTLRFWLQLAREERQRIVDGGVPDPEKRRYLALLAAVEDAEADAGITWLQVVDKAAQNDPSWAWRMLKQRFPEGFQDIVEQKITGPNGGAVQVEHDLTDNAVADILSILAGAGALQPGAQESGDAKTK